jgi:hypothetical protein
MVRDDNIRRLKGGRESSAESDRDQRLRKLPLFVGKVYLVPSLERSRTVSL